MKCPTCGAENQDNADFCNLCFTSFKSKDIEDAVIENPETPTRSLASQTALTLSLSLLFFIGVVSVGGPMLPMRDMGSMALIPPFLLGSAFIALALAAFIAGRVIFSPRISNLITALSITASLAILVPHFAERAAFRKAHDIEYAELMVKMDAERGVDHEFIQAVPVDLSKIDRVSRFKEFSGEGAVFVRGLDEQVPDVKKAIFTLRTDVDPGQKVAIYAPFDGYIKKVEQDRIILASSPTPDLTWYFVFDGVAPNLGVTEGAAFKPGSTLGSVKGDVLKIHLLEYVKGQERFYVESFFTYIGYDPGKKSALLVDEFERYGLPVFDMNLYDWDDSEHKGAEEFRIKQSNPPGQSHLEAVAGTYQRLTGNTAVQGHSLRVTGETDLPDDAKISVVVKRTVLMVGEEAERDPTIGEAYGIVRGGKYEVTVPLDERAVTRDGQPRSVSHNCWVKISFHPLWIDFRQSDEVLRLVGAKGQNLRGPLAREVNANLERVRIMAIRTFVDIPYVK